MAVVIAPIENGDSGLSIREKLNLIFEAAAVGGLGAVSPEDIDALIDVIPPDVPEGLTLTSEVEPANLTAAWDFNSEDDFVYYDLQIKEGSGPWVGYQTSAERQIIPCLPNVTYSARIRAVDKSGNASAFSAIEVHTTDRDTIPPAMPIGVHSNAGLDSIWITWVANTETDLARYELYESAVSTTPIDSTTPSHSTFANSFVRAGLSMETHLYFWVRAVDTSGNVSPWSAPVDDETGKIRGEIKVTLSGVTFLPGQAVGGNRLVWSFGSISYGVAGDEPTVQALPSGQVDYIAGTVFVCYVPGDAVITTTTSLTTLYANDAIVLGVYKGGNDFQLVLGKAYQDGGLILAQTIGANQLVTNSAVITGSAQIANAIITNAKIVDLDAAKLIAGSVMTGSVLVNGAYRLDDGGAAVNNGTTKIVPGQIYISSGTSLSNWIAGGGTYMDGAMISAGSITADKAVFGQRGITVEGIQFQANSPTSNKVAWSAGTIKYIGDDGNIATFNITGSNATWSTGTLYVYYVKGGTTLAATNNVATAFQSDRVVLAAYKGGTDLVVNFGRTIIDGSQISTGTITAAQADIASFRTSILIAGSITATMLSVTSLSAITANLGTVTAGKMQNAGGTMIIDLDNGFISISVP